LGFHALILAHMLDSLVRVSRRVVTLHFARVPNSKGYQHKQLPWEPSALQAIQTVNKTRSHWTLKHVVGTSVSTTATRIASYNIHKWRTSSLSISRSIQTDSDVTPMHRAPGNFSPNEICTGYNTGNVTVPFQQFQVLFNSLFKVLFIFPSRYLFAIGLAPIFSFRSEQRREYHPPCCPLPRDLSQVAMLITATIDYNSPSQMAILSLSSSRFTRRYWGNPC